MRRRVLVTGMSGTGKSSALVELRRRGFDVVDTDEAGWTKWRDDDGHVWREDRIDAVLARDRAAPLFVSGTVSNQRRFYPLFDAVVLLSAPAEVLLERIESRTTNDYGKRGGARAHPRPPQGGGTAPARHVHARDRHCAAARRCRRRAGLDRCR
jgi:hypothetical protein